MDAFNKYILQQEYNKLAKIGDRLAKADQLINWEAFRPIIKNLYRNDTEQGGRPNADEVVMVKLLVLQQCRGLMSWRSRLTTGSASNGSSVGRASRPTTRRSGASGSASPHR
jgi:hypothetical protein